MSTSQLSQKDRWHRETVAFVRRVAKLLGLRASDRAIRSNKGGPAVGGEVTMSAPGFGVYLHLSCPLNSYGEPDISVGMSLGAHYARKATHDDPYGGGFDKPNHSFHWMSEDQLAEKLQKIASN